MDFGNVMPGMVQGYVLFSDPEAFPPMEEGVRQMYCVGLKGKLPAWSKAYVHSNILCRTWLPGPPLTPRYLCCCIVSALGLDGMQSKLSKSCLLC